MTRIGTAVLGRSVVDRITGFGGVATAYASHISGSNRVLVTPPIDKDGALAEEQWFDEERINVKAGDEQTVLDLRF